MFLSHPLRACFISQRLGFFLLAHYDLWPLFYVKLSSIITLKHYGKGYFSTSYLQDDVCLYSSQVTLTSLKVTADWCFTLSPVVTATRPCIVSKNANWQCFVEFLKKMVNISFFYFLIKVSWHVSEARSSADLLRDHFRIFIPQHKALNIFPLNDLYLIRNVDVPIVFLGL